MKVFVFDLLAYDANLDHLKEGGPELPYPLPKRHFDAATAERTYEEHLDAWEALDRFGYDGVGFNEHHCSPYGLMNSPNLMAASAAQRTKRLKLLIYGNLLPVHQPLRLAEELAMLDCLSKGRLISGFARGIPREYQVHNVPLAESRARFEEAYEIIRRAWTEEVFSYEGQFWQYHDVALWPRPVQQPHPPVWVPVTASKETIEWAGKHNIPITPGASPHRGVREDVIRFYARNLEHVKFVSGSRERYRGLTLEGIREQAEYMPWGTPDEVVERIISAADHAGANQITVSLNRGAMPHEMFMHQIRRLAAEVLPRLQ